VAGYAAAKSRHDVVDERIRMVWDEDWFTKPADPRDLRNQVSPHGRTFLVRSGRTFAAGLGGWSGPPHPMLHVKHERAFWSGREVAARGRESGRRETRGGRIHKRLVPPRGLV
jgi:hypothetical protein